jgi:prophage antirepressor-like protein
MDILKAFVLEEKEHNINILWKDEKPLFRASEIGKILEIKDIHTSIKNFDEDEKCRHIVPTPGGPQETLFLTKYGVYRILMVSRKPIAKPFQKWLYKVIENIEETGKYELQLKINETVGEALKNEGEKTKKEIEKNKHNAIIEAFRDRYLVYFAKICEKDDGKWLIKIGSTKELQIRVPTLLKDFKFLTILKVFECPKNEAFEKFLHNHQGIKKFKFEDEEFHSNETFLVTEDEFDKIISIAIHNKHNFSSIVEHEHIIELETIKLKQLEEKNKGIELKKEIIKITKENIEDEDKDEDVDKIEDEEDETYIDPVILLGDFRKHTQTKGNKIQKYSPDGKTLIKTYESFAYAMRDKEVSNSTSRGCIKKAIENRIIYKDFRWAELDRNMADDTFQDIGETVCSKTVKIGYIAMLNLNKDKIVNVFSDQKDAAKDRKFVGGAAISNAIKRESASGGHYFVMWDNCSDELKDKYLLENNLPDKKVAVNGIRIEQVHPITNKIIKEYVSFEDVIKEFKVSRKTLKSACDYDIICKGYKWKLK